ncbi:unnamed protein product [Rangifer tarandus platyrhynchus]|uniref:Uncharacterized protein n=1 Tax=Rangifer tarandus platyrhynchus TaxID=3082113 RepID=A0ABN8XTL7_RANTA|nr:unnamed protein product [Rangifer tarandus platyrhynchus]
MNTDVRNICSGRELKASTVVVEFLCWPTSVSSTSACPVCLYSYYMALVQDVHAVPAVNHVHCQTFLVKEPVCLTQCRHSVMAALCSTIISAHFMGLPSFESPAVRQPRVLEEWQQMVAEAMVMAGRGYPRPATPHFHHCAGCNTAAWRPLSAPASAGCLILRPLSGQISRESSKGKSNVPQNL